MSDSTPVYYTVAALNNARARGGEPRPLKHKQAASISVQKEQWEQREKSAEVKKTKHVVFVSATPIATVL